ncbi:MAG TPA: hypothetical protein VK699_21610 [Terriglobales bacterium]|jgi:hypothetical protein|nr:hypothetical protein [Terriglobales bacterium]
MNQLKQILLNQYIGAIVIAFVWAQAVISLVQLVTQPTEMLIIKILDQSNYSQMFGQQSFKLNWALTLAGILYAVALFLAGYLLAMWIYAQPKTSPATESVATDED